MTVRTLLSPRVGVSVYKLSKRVISQFIRTGCRRRLRLDLYARSADRHCADVPDKDAGRPGLALLHEQGKEYERAKYREMEAIFPELVIHGPYRAFVPGEDRAFEPIYLGDHIDMLQPHHFLLEAQFEITSCFRDAHQLRDLE